MNIEFEAGNRYAQMLTKIYDTDARLEVVTNQCVHYPSVDYAKTAEIRVAPWVPVRDREGKLIFSI